MIVLVYILTLWVNWPGDRAYWPGGSPHVSNHRLIAMYHSATPEYNKEVVLASPSGICRVVSATSSLGMGVEVKGLIAPDNSLGSTIMP